MTSIDPSPWAVTASAEPATEYLGLVSQLRFRGADGLEQFQLLVTDIIQQLGQAQGLLGWSMADGNDSSYWTLSVWRDENALREFMLQDPHRQVMRKLRPFAVGRFVRFPIHGSELPPTWVDAVARLPVEGP